MSRDSVSLSTDLIEGEVAGDGGGGVLVPLLVGERQILHLGAQVRRIACFLLLPDF